METTLVTLVTLVDDLNRERILLDYSGVFSTIDNGVLRLSLLD